MSEIIHVCQACPRPSDVDYDEYKDQLGHMKAMEYTCPKCGVCRSCGNDSGYEFGEELFLTGGSN